MTRNNFLICFTGMDGSGKTTHAKTLAKVMEEHGIKNKYVWNRFEPSIVLRPFMAIASVLFLHGRDVFGNYIEYSNSKKRLFRNHFLSAMYQYIVLVDYYLQILLRIKIPLIFGKTIICDRYVYDTIVDLTVYSHYTNAKIKNMLKNLFYLLPKPNLIFLIDLPEVVAFQRKEDTPSIEYLRERRDIYLHIGKEQGMVILDGSKELNELEGLIRKEVFGELKIK
jgi:thymidylate kinase